MSGDNRNYIRGSSLMVFAFFLGIGLCVLGIGIGDEAGRYAMRPLATDRPQLAKLSIPERKATYRKLSNWAIGLIVAGVAVGGALFWQGMKIRAR